MDFGWITFTEQPFCGSLVAMNTHSAKSISIHPLYDKEMKRGIPIIVSFSDSLFFTDMDVCIINISIIYRTSHCWEEFWMRMVSQKHISTSFEDD